ncbi:hypothetical protein [Polluticaenibacter yanchengensis]|uniref:Uncharacterized protein n=1 Tax=Polluticaenibacter yanchengensis TaxID=3014562 RepID=A0ABT4UG80_9BACT|nr:hypothetical protein [Chitinophagaceae bacterium LY-5]
MRKIVTIFIALLSFLSANAQDIDLEYVRSNYDKAIKDEKLCKSLIEALSKSTGSNTHLAYLGAFQTIWANHTFSPISKLSTFKKGKQNIEKAINSNQNNIETRFIRLSIQKNCPSFLGYRQNINEDKQFINEHKDKIASGTLLQLVNKVLQ